MGVGLFATALFALLAAVYLSVEVEHEPDLAEDFRGKALRTSAVVAVLAAVTAALTPGAAPELAAHLLGTPIGWGLLAGAAVALGGAVLLLGRRRDRGARMLVVLATTLVLLGWGVGQYPWLVADAITIQEAAAPRVTLVLVMWILGLGSLILIPAFVYLYAVFKGGTLFPWMREPRTGEASSD